MTMCFGALNGAQTTENHRAQREQNLAYLQVPLAPLQKTGLHLLKKRQQPSGAQSPETARRPDARRTQDRKTWRLECSECCECATTLWHYRWERESWKPISRVMHHFCCARSEKMKRKRHQNADQIQRAWY